MPCNCSKKATAKGFVYVAPTGKTTKHATEIEAKAAQVRAGGGGQVRPASA